MHEMSIAISLLELAENELKKNGCNRVTRLVVEYGALAGIMPEALQFCFENLISTGPHKGAILELREIPVKLRCPQCGAVFGVEGAPIVLQSCPECEALSGLNVEQGKELILLRLEADAKGGI